MTNKISSEEFTKEIKFLNLPTAKNMKLVVINSVMYSGSRVTASLVRSHPEVYIYRNEIEDFLYQSLLPPYRNFSSSLKKNI